MRTAITPRFDKALFPLVPMDHQQHWANVDNTIDVQYRDREQVAFIEVSATLFPILADIGVPVDSNVTLFLESDGPKMLFGIIVDDTVLYDLWHYTMDRVPRELLP